ncbi:MAG: tellurite resistance TerB family protein [Caulobacterales bacterium]|nr:tellurite resistance TerB family protein [Caulobacterales bacterium]
MFDADKIIAALQRELPKGLNAIKTEGGAMIDRVKTDEQSKNTAMGAAAAGAIGALLLSGVMGKFGRKVATIGGVAALGNLAYQAYKKHANTADEQKFLPSGEQKEALGKLTLKAIINAMKADGIIDETEKAKLYESLKDADLSDEEKAFLFDEMAKPIDTMGLVAAISDKETAIEIYAASFVAINPNGQAEANYLNDLAAKLNISPELAQSVREEALAN